MSQAMMTNFNAYIMPFLMTTLQQKIDVFNASSGGAILLTSKGFTGDFLQQSFWNGVQAALREVDQYAANGAITPTDLTQGKRSIVKIKRGFGPVLFEPGQLAWLLKPTSEGIEVITRSLSDAMVADQLNTTIAALVGAIANQAALVNDVSASSGLTQVALNDSHAKFGDQSGRLITEVMTGAAYHKLIGRNLTNAQALYTADNVQVVSILGKRMVVTDAPALYTAGTPNKTRVLSLVQGAAEMSDSGDMLTNIVSSNGKARIETTFQTEYTMSLGLKGFTWDEANGGKSPLNAALATGTNWDKTAATTKEMPGVMTIVDAAL